MEPIVRDRIPDFGNTMDKASVYLFMQAKLARQAEGVQSETEVDRAIYAGMAQAVINKDR